jgi:hypothetical protein
MRARRGLADAGQFEKLGRVDRAGGEDHLAVARARGAVVAGGSARRSRAALEHDQVPPAPGHDAQVRAPQRRAQEGLGGVPAHAARWLTSKKPEPSLSPSLKSARGGMPNSGGALLQGSRMSQAAAALHPPLAAAPCIWLSPA